MSFLVDQALNLLDLEHEAAALALIGRLQDCWPDIRQEVPALSDADDIFSLLMQLDEHIAEAREKLQALDIKVDEVKALSQRLKDAWEESVPDSLRKLLRPLSEFSETEHGDEFGEVQWRPLTVAGSRIGQLADKGIGFRPRLNAKAAVEVEAGAIAPVDMLPDVSYLRIGFDGDVSVGAKLDMPLRFGLISNTSVEASAALNFWFALAGDAQRQAFVSAAAKMTRHLPNPFSFSSLWRAADDGFAAVRLQTQAALAQSVSMRFSLRNFAVKPSSGASLTGSSINIDNDVLQFDVGIERKRSYDMSVCSSTTEDGDKSLILSLNRRHHAEHAATSSLTFALDFRALALQVKGVLDGALQDYRTLTKNYGRFLTPGTLLLDELEPKLDRALKQAVTGDSALKDLLRATLGDEDARNAVLQEHLKDVLVKPAAGASQKAAGILDQGVGLLSAGSDKVADRLIERLSALFGRQRSTEAAARIEQRAAAAREDLSELAQKLKTAIDERLEEEVFALFETGGTRARRAFEQVDEFRRKAGQAAIDTADSLDAALAGVRGFLASVDARTAGLMAALGDAARHRLTLRIGSEERLSFGASANLQIEFSANRSNVQRLYDKVTRGDFDQTTLDAIENIPGVTALSGELAYFAASHSQRVVEIGVLGFSGGASTVFDSRVDIRVDIDGNVVVDSDLSTSRSLGGVRERQEISFLSPFDLHTAKQTRVLATSLTASQEDANLEPNEIEDFLDDFVRLGLIGRATLTAAISQLTEWRNAAGNNDFKARVDVSLTLDAEAIHTLLGTASGLFEDAADDAQTEDEARLEDDRVMLETALDALVEAGAFKPVTINRAAKRLRDFSRRYRRLSIPEEVLLAVRLKVLDRNRATRASKAFVRAPFGNSLGFRKIHALTDRRGALGHAHKLHVLVKGFAVALRTLHEIYTLDTAGINRKALAKQLDAQNALIAFCLKAWMRPSRKFLWLPNDDIHEISHAFFLALADQAGLLTRAAEGESIMSVVLRVPGELEKTRVF